MQQPPEGYSQSSSDGYPQSYQQQTPYAQPQQYYQQPMPPQQQQPPQYYQQPMPPQQQQQYYPPQQYQQPYQGVPSMYPAPGQPMMMPQQPIMQTNVNVNVQQKSGPGFLIRALYFWFFGWWAGLIWLNIGFGLCALVITLPIGLMMLNRLPQIMTLKSPGTSTNVNISTVSVAQPGGGGIMVQNINVNVGGTQQHNFLLRAFYFLFVGCWAGYLWANLAYACCLTIFLLPVGIMMFDRLPAVLTLRKN